MCCLSCIINEILFVESMVVVHTAAAASAVYFIYIHEKKVVQKVFVAKCIIIFMCVRVHVEVVDIRG